MSEYVFFINFSLAEIVIVLVAVISQCMTLLNVLDVVKQAFADDIGFAIACLFCLFVFFGPKAYLLRVGAEFDANLKVKIVTQTNTMNVENKADREANLLKLRFLDVIEEFSRLKENSRGTNIKVCRDQIDAANLKKAEIAAKHIAEWKEIAEAVESDRLIGVLNSTITYYNNYRIKDGSLATTSN